MTMLDNVGPNVRRTDPDTSHAAAAPLRLKDRVRVLNVHSNNPEGLTDFELADIVGRQQTSAGKRRGELRDLLMIEDSLTRRPAPSGSMAIVWRITDLGRITNEALPHATARLSR